MSIDWNKYTPGPRDVWAFGEEAILDVLGEELPGGVVEVTLVGDRGGRISRRFGAGSVYALRRAAYAAGYAPPRGEKASAIVEAIRGRVLQEHPWPR